MYWMLMPLKRYAEFSGRSRRMEFWMWQLAKILFTLAFMIIMGVIFGASIMGLARSGSGAAPSGAAMAGLGIGVLFYLLFLLAGLAIIIPDIAVSVRRLHDTNRSGLWLFAVIGPYIGGYIVMLAGALAQSSAVALFGSVLLIVGLVMAIVLLVFFCLPGSVGANRFGPDPMIRDIGQVFA